MKKNLKLLMVGLFVLPCLILLAACGDVTVEVPDARGSITKVTDLQGYEDYIRVNFHGVSFDVNEFLINPSTGAVGQQWVTYFHFSIQNTSPFAIVEFSVDITFNSNSSPSFTFVRTFTMSLMPNEFREMTASRALGHQGAWTFETTTPEIINAYIVS